MVTASCSWDGFTFLETFNKTFLNSGHSYLTDIEKVYAGKISSADIQNRFIIEIYNDILMGSVDFLSQHVS